MGSASARAFGLEPGETAASALFVSRSGAKALPWVYIAAAIVTTVARPITDAKNGIAIPRIDVKAALDSVR